MVWSATQEAAQEDGDGRPASYGMNQSGLTAIFPSVATTHIAYAGPAPCVARGVFGAEVEEASTPGFDSVGGDNGGRCGDFKTVMCAKIMWEVGL